jgi:hypothetical protein
MAEGGKYLIARGIVRTVEQYVRLNGNSTYFQLISWGNEVRCVEWNPDEEFPPEMFDCNGMVSIESLIPFLNERPNNKLMLITDGFWSQKDIKAFVRWKNKLIPDSLRIIKIGVDANQQLKGTDVFPAEDLFAALDGWLEAGVV